MAKVAFYADIYYDSEHSPEYWIPPAELDVDAILLGGDIHYSPRHLGDMVAGIRRTQPDSTRIIVVPGNGEYVNLELTGSRREYTTAVAAVPGAAFLDNETLTLPGGVRIIGSTLWSDVPADQVDDYNAMWAEHGMNGVDNIRLGDRFLTVQDANELHLTAREFLARELKSLSAAEREQTIVCTHFWPTLRPWTDSAGDPDPGPAWLHMIGTDLDELIAQAGPKFWLCGHAHTTHQVRIGTTLVASNPRAGDGPGNVNPEFAEAYVVEL